MKDFRFTISINGKKLTCYYCKTPSIAEKLQQKLLQRSSPCLGFDIETGKKTIFYSDPQAGLCPYRSFPSLLQFYDGIDTIYMFDVKYLPLTMFQPIFSEKRVIAHNAIFDAAHMKHNGIVGAKFDCSMIMYNLVTCAQYANIEEEEAAIEEGDGQIGDWLTKGERYSASLRTVTAKLLQIRVDKDLQISDWTSRPLSREQLIYAAKDSWLTFECGRILSRNINSLNLTRIYKLNRQAIEPVTTMMLNGSEIDEKKHRKDCKQWAKKKDALQIKVLKIFGREMNIRSVNQISRWLDKNLHPAIQHSWPRSIKTGKLKSDAKTLTLHSHLKFVTPLLEYKKLEKMLSTYGLPLLDKINPVTRRLHGSYTLGFTATGRLSSRSPNLQNLPRDSDIRGIFRAAEGSTLVGADYCFTGDTLIDTPKGDVPIAKLNVDDLVFTYRKGKPAVGKVTQHVCVGKAPCVRVKLDNEKTITCTAEHKFLVICSTTREIKKVKAGELLANDRLLPLRRTEGGGGYIHLYSHTAFKYSKEHIIVAEAALGPRPVNYHTHHIDENKRNNKPTNLEYLPKSKHLRDHSIVNYKKQNHILRIKNLRRALKYRRTYVGKENPNWGKLKGKEVSCLFCKRTFYKSPSCNAKYCCRDCYTDARSDGLNCKVVSVTPTRNYTVYSIAVSPDKNYALSAGVFVSNSQIELRTAAELSRDKTMLKAYRDGIDLHSLTASKITGRRIEQVTKEARQLAKSLNFGLLFGLGAAGLIEYARWNYGVVLDRSTAYEHYKTFFDTYSGYADWQKRQRRACELSGTTSTVLGKVRKLQKNGMYTRSVNHPVQGSAAEVVITALCKIDKYLGKSKGVKLINCVHDEVILEVEEEKSKMVSIALQAEMEVAMKDIFPKASMTKLVEVKTGRTWADTH